MCMIMLNGYKCHRKNSNNASLIYLYLPFLMKKKFKVIKLILWGFNLFNAFTKKYGFIRVLFQTTLFRLNKKIFLYVYHHLKVFSKLSNQIKAYDAGYWVRLFS